MSPEQRRPHASGRPRASGTASRIIDRRTFSQPEPVDQTTLVDVLDRVLERGVVIQGDVVLGLAGVDLVHVGLHLIIEGLDGPLE